MPSLFTFLLLLSGAAASPCSKKYFPTLLGNPFVCVCNATYCDEYEDPQVSDQTAIIYSSSQSTDRMAVRTAQITNSSAAGTSLLGSMFPSSTGKITLNAQVTYQQIIGFGSAFTDSAGINIASLSQPSQDRLMNTLFGKTGARYSTGRVPIASNDFSTSIYSYDDNAGDLSMSNFALAQADLQYKIPFILRALNLTGSDLRLFSSPWSAPAWMKDTGKMEGPGHLVKGMEAAWAKYFVRFFEEYLAQGISFWATTVQNEPQTTDLPYWGWQAMSWNSSGERSFVSSYLGPSLAASNAAKNVKIISLDDSRLYLPTWANDVFSDPVASSFISGVGIHWYFDTVAPASVLTATHIAHPDKFILGTEACAGWVPAPVLQGPSLGDWQRAENYASNIMQDLNNFVAGWTDWNLALDTQGGPTWASNFVDATVIVNATADEFYKQPTHYAFTHFSRFLRPGATRVQSTAVGIDAVDVKHTAFVMGDQRIVIILNTLTTESAISLGEADGTSITVNIAPKSITTVTWMKQ